MQENLSTATLEVDCSKWAEDFAGKILKDEGPFQFYLFKPKQTIPQARYLGDFTDENGKSFSPNPPWRWHIAVRKNGKLHDEIHPAGVKVDEYLLYFECHDCITVTFHSDFESALALAMG